MCQQREAHRSPASARRAALLPGPQPDGRLRRRRTEHLHDEIPGLRGHGLVLPAGAYDRATTDLTFEGFARKRLYGFVNNELRKRRVAANDITDADDVEHDAYADEMHSRVTSGRTREASRGPESTVGRRQERERALAVLREERAALRPLLRQLLELRYDRELSWELVAGCLGLSVATTWRRHAWAIKQLGPRLRARGVTRDSLSRQTGAA